MKPLTLAKLVVHLLCLTPLALLGWRFWDVWRNGSDALGADPVSTIEHTLGLWALRLLRNVPKSSLRMKGLYKTAPLTMATSMNSVQTQMIQRPHSTLM